MEDPLPNLYKHVKSIIRAGNISKLTSKTVRKQLEEIYGFGLKQHKDIIEAAILRALRKHESNTSDGDAQKAKPKEAEEENKVQKRAPAAEADAEEVRLRKVIAACGLQSKTRFKGVREMSSDTVKERLRDVLVCALGTDRPDHAQIEKFKAKRELDLELDGIDTTNIVSSSSKRPRRAAAQEQALCSYTVDQERIEDEDDE